MTFSLLVTCPKGLEYLLDDELTALGLLRSRVSPQGVYGTATLEVIYAIALWSRIANRVLLVLCEGAAVDQQALYALSHQFSWQSVFDLDTRLSISFQGTSLTIRNSMFGAQVIKDGIVDYCRDNGIERPTIDRIQPNIRLRAYLHHDVVTLCFDLTGYSLHQRGYRLEAGEAPLKENVAAAILVRAKWPQLMDEDYGLHDPFCGSGTLVIEAAMMAARIAPGLMREDQSFVHWHGHDAKLWADCRAKAHLQQIKPSITCCGSDADKTVVAMAEDNAHRAGVSAFTHWSVQAVSECKPLNTLGKGLVIANPPYGERLSDTKTLIPLYEAFGQTLFHAFSGWEAAVLTSNPDLAKAIGLRAHKFYKFYNGTLACQLYCITLDASNRLRTGPATIKYSPGAEMFANRLKKNVAHLKSWVLRNHLDCYRVYDADLPEYAYAIDVYKDYVVLQEYAPPATILATAAQQRSEEVIAMTALVLQKTPEQLVVKQRVRQKGDKQYEKISQQREYMTVSEGGALLRVNLRDYLDTGLFLDHRILRLRFATLPADTKFLNCFSYTGTASVHAALAGASTTSVDLSNTYLTWAQENFRLNNIDVSKHQFIQYDCMEWLKLTRDRFDVIFLDPPSFSNSKRMSQVLDIARDHEQLIRDTMSLLTPGGTLYFSTNFRQFKLSASIVADYAVRDITHETIDLDFKRNAKIHCCYQIQFKPS